MGSLVEGQNSGGRLLAMKLLDQLRRRGKVLNQQAYQSTSLCQGICSSVNDMRGNGRHTKEGRGWVSKDGRRIDGKKSSTEISAMHSPITLCVAVAGRSHLSLLNKRYNEITGFISVLG